MTGLSDIRGRVSASIRDAQERYEDLGRFQKLRILIMVVLIADIAVTGLVLIVLTRGPSPVTASYRPDFPTRLLIVRNRSRVFVDAEVVLDDTYQHVLPRLEVGSVGIELRDFRDAEGLPPDISYRPTKALIVTSGGRFELRVHSDDDGP